MGGTTDVYGAHCPDALCHSGSDCESGPGAVARVGLSVMDPVIITAALIIIAVEMYIRLL